MRILTITFAVLFSLTLLQSGIEVIELDIDKATIPEGIVVHPVSGEIYISSLHLHKITRSDRDGKNSVNVIKQKARGYTTGVGMVIRGKYLFALGSFLRQKRSVLLQIDLDKNKIINSYSIAGDRLNFLNDLAVDNNFNAYITDTDYSRIYKFDYLKGTIELFMKGEQIEHPNGIAISSDQTKLFVDSYSFGVRIIDIESKKILNKPDETTKTGLDGLKYYDNKLYGVVNGGEKKEEHRVIELRLSDDQKEIVDSRVLIRNHPKMDVPTTLSIAGGYIYLLANSQLPNLDQQENKIIDPGKLTNTYILKFKISGDQNHKKYPPKQPGY